MPLYEYRCESCGARRDVLQTMGATGAELVCEACGSTEMKKMPTAAATPRNALPGGGKTCCGRDERCDSPKGGCCGH